MVLCAIANLLIGGALYGILYKVLLSEDDDSKAVDRVPMSSSYAPAAMHDTDMQ